MICNTFQMSRIKRTLVLFLFFSFFLFGGCQDNGDSDNTDVQDNVFSVDQTVSPDATVTIVSSGDETNSVWFAPSGTTTFAEGTTMTKAASGTATTVIAPNEEGIYYLYVVNTAGEVSPPSNAILTVVQGSSSPDTTAPTNQDEVFSANQTVLSGATVTIVSSGDGTNNVWFAPSGTTTFSEGTTMTKAASGTATSILAPSADGTYYLYVVDAAGNVSSPSSAVLTVDSTAPTNQDVVFSADEMSTANNTVTIVSSEDETNNVWFAPSGTTTFAEGTTMTKAASGTSTSIIAPEDEDSYYLYIVDAVGNVSSPSSAKLTVSTYFKQDAYLKASNSGTGDIFGKSVAISGDYMVVGSVSEDSDITSVENDDGSASGTTGASESGAAYVFKKDGSGDWIQDAYLKASNSGASDQFGRSVAISGDTIVVSAIYEDSGATGVSNNDGGHDDSGWTDGSGAVYVFKKESSSGDWVQDAHLKASNSATDLWFGWSVAISGDLIVVSAYREGGSATAIDNDDGSPGTNSGAANSGAAYVFKRESNGDWVQDAYLKASNNVTNLNFGWSVGISGDLIVVGSHSDDSNSTGVNNTDGSASTDTLAANSGAAFVFKRENGNWVQDAYLKSSNSVTTDSFGKSVAINDEIIVVGAEDEDSTSTTVENGDGLADTNGSLRDSGAAYVFKRNDEGDWIQDAYLKASNTSELGDDGDKFGQSVAISGNLIVVGAYSEDSNATEVTNNNGSADSDNSQSLTGAAYVFRKENSGNWIQDAYLKASNSGEQDYFGYKVAVGGNLIVVAAELEDSDANAVVNNDDSVSGVDTGADNSGAAYIFKLFVPD